MKKTLSILLIIALISLLAYPVTAEPLSSNKEEVIYGILDEYGQVQQIYAINSFNQGNIIDYGTYSEVKNLSTNDEITIEDDLITVNSDTQRLHYQGTMDSKTLPWIINIQYLLDKEILQSDKIAGKSGEVEIKISVKPNPLSDSFFYENYTLSVTVKLDERIFSNIQTNNAVIANAGLYKQLSYTILPNKELDISIKAHADKFEMESVTFGGVRMIMDMPIDTDSLTERFSELSDAIEKLDDGAEDLTNAFESYVSGLEQYTEALTSFNDGITQLSAGIREISEGSSGLSYGLNALSGQGEPLAQAIYAIMQKTFQTANSQIQQMDMELPVLTEQNYSKILENIPQLSALKEELDGICQLKAGVDTYTDSVTQLSQAAAKLNTGLQQINLSAATIKQYSDTLTNSASTLQSAAIQLKEGLIEYKNGVNMLNGNTKGLDAKISEEIDNMIKDIFGDTDIVKSYISEKNTSVESVQFVIKSEAVKAEKQTDAPVIAEPKLTFWQKLLKLFGLYS